VTTIAIEGRLRAPEQTWHPMTFLGEFATVEDAEAKCRVLTRAMPMKDFRVLETDDEDIPF